MNNLTKSISLVRFFSVLLLFLFFYNPSAAQDVGFDKGKQYILGGIEVTGIKTYNESTVITYTGLRPGQAIVIPSEEVSKILKKLWDLDLFSDISLFITKVEGNKIFLELNIKEVPTISDIKVTGIKPKRAQAIINDTDLKKGKKLTENFTTTTKNYIINKYKKQGYLNAKVNMITVPDTTQSNALKLQVNIDKGEKVKISRITFSGNEKIKSKRLRKALKKTKRKFPLRFWRKSKFIEENYREDLSSLVDAYKERGYRDARIVRDTVIYDREKNTIAIDVDVLEGSKYYFGDIDFVGNTAYSDQFLRNVLGLAKGETYNGVLLKKRIQDDTRPDGQDITNLYQNNGYLFSRINTVEVSAENDTIDFEVRIIEGKPAYINHVTVKGNDKTNDHVIYRSTRVRPGQLYSKDNVIRTIRELGQLGFFDAENIRPDIKNPDPEEGTVDIEYSVVEKGGSQIELQGGFGGGGFIGTLGLSFSNFSIRNIFNKEAYQPVPSGDGQRLSLRLQASRTFQTFSFSFTEPWLGGKKPVQFSVSLSRTTQFRFDILTRDVDRDQRFIISGITLGLAKRLQWPDNFFTLSHALQFQNFDLQNFTSGLFTFGNGFSNNLSYTIGLSRRELSRNPIYPTWGSEFNVSAKVTFPYSLFNGIDYGDLENQPEFQLRDAQGRIIGSDGRPISETGLDPVPDVAAIDQQRFNWLEFYKIKFSGKWYTTIYDKLVLQTSAEFGFLGAYNNDRGVIPFERFFLGGDGLGNFTLDGRENIALRGYPNQSITTINDDTGLLNQDGQAIYNKFSLELRYPLTLKPSASIYGLVFVEGGNAFDNFRNFNPFQLQRSAGFGVRIFLPAFGLLGIDFGHGFDPLPGQVEPNGWETHFIIGQQF